MLNTTRRFFKMLALRYCALMSDGWLQFAFFTSSTHDFKGCSASGFVSQKGRR